MTPPRLVLFDCDGVLVDTETIANRRLVELFNEAGFATDYDYCRRHFSGRSLTSVQEEIEASGVSLGADFVDRWNEGLPALFADRVEAIPHVRQAVEAVRDAGIAYCVATSARISKMHITLGATGLMPLFEHALFSATMVARGKPAPDGYLLAAEQLGVAAADCIVVEDAAPGVQAGLAAGMRVLGFTTTQPAEAMRAATWVVPDISCVTAQSPMPDRPAAGPVRIRLDRVVG
jgi:HAD superfamily hydrolase (TIGR01509 family)